jgi:uncharacterized metal-binding protein YceD (DUF177 family)
MNWLSQYTIKFSGLSEGMHLFEFSADKRFFAGFEESEIAEAGVNIQVELEKRSTYLRLNFLISGEVELVCDRCLEKYMQPLQSQFPVLVKFSDTETEDTDEVIYLQYGEHEVYVGKLIYEFIVLSIPIRHVHPEDAKGNSSCDPEMLKKIDEYRVTEVKKDTDFTDPRWNDLKQIIGN